MLLEAKDLYVSYGAIKAIKGVSFSVDEGQIVCIIGSNGAGKSTIMNTISGIVKPDSGSITFDGEDMLAYPPHEIVRKGIVQVPEGRGIFGPLTVLENLDVAASTRKDKGNIEADYKHVFEIFPRLEERKYQKAGTLSGGEQQMLAVARGLISKGKIILLDEPSMGLAPALVEEIFKIILRIRDEGTTILLVEQNAFQAMSIADYAYVLETGNVVLEGPAKQLKSDPKIKEAYLGG